MDRVLTHVQWYQEPSKCSPTPTRKPNSTASAATQTRASRAPRLLAAAHPPSATLRARQAVAPAPCSRKRYRPRRCSGSSLAEEGRSADLSVCLLAIADCRSSWQEIAMLIRDTGGGIFDTGPGFVFNLGGGPGIRVHQFGGGRPRRRPGTAQPPGSEPAPSLSSTLSSLLPLLFLFILPLLSSVFSSSSVPQGPAVVFDSPRPPNTQERVSVRLKVPYYVDPREVEGYNNKAWVKLDQTAESKYIHTINVRCENERFQQQKMEQDALGWFRDDEDMKRQARELPMRNCKRLKELGITWY